MRTRRLLAAALVSVTLAGCASAADVASSDRAEKVRRHSSPGKQTPKNPPKTSDSTPTQSGPSSPTTSPSLHGPRKNTKQLPNVVGAIPVFLTPSHNIGCAIGDGQVRCDIREHQYRDPEKPAGCRGDYGQSIFVTKTGIARFGCVADTVIARRAPVLSYGSSSVVGDFGCTSRQSGIRCYFLKSKHGFWLSREHPALF